MATGWTIEPVAANWATLGPGPRDDMSWDCFIEPSKYDGERNES
jgi:hypothetical protein